MSGRDEDDAIEAATQAAALEAFAEYEAREEAARATTARRTATPLRSVALDPFAELTPVVAPGARSIVAQPPEAAPARVLVSRVEAWLAAARRADYFALLGLTPRATEGTILRTHADARAVLDALEITRVITEARALLDEAASVLGDPTTRARYARHVGPQVAVPIFWLPEDRPGP